MTGSIVKVPSDRHRGSQTCEGGRLLGQPFPARGRDPVELGAAIRLGLSRRSNAAPSSARIRRMPRFLPLLLAMAVLGGEAQEAVKPSYRTLDDRFKPREYPTLPDWQRRAEYLRAHVLASAGLAPLPEKTPLRPQIFDEKLRPDYSVAKVYFESLPGFYVTGHLYRPQGAGPLPAILTPHGRWPYARFKNPELNSVPARAINRTRQGFVVF